MSNAAYIKTHFVSAVLSQTAELIRAKQISIVDEWNLFETGQLKQSLQGHFAVSNQEGGGKLGMSYLTYARWLDMQNSTRKVKREGYAHYNRTVFGILYNRTLPAVKYGFTDEVHKNITQLLAEVAATDPNRAALMAKSLRTGYF